MDYYEGKTMAPGRPHLELFAPHDWRKIPVALVASLSLAISGCSIFDDTELGPSFGPVPSAGQPETPSPQPLTEPPAPSPTIHRSEVPTASAIPTHTASSAHPETSSSSPDTLSPQPSPSAQTPKPTVKKQTMKDIRTCGNDSGKILLTFDDSGPHEHIMAIKNKLKSRGLYAIFFLNNGLVSKKTINALIADGYGVQNHTADHPNLVPLSEKGIRKAIKSGYNEPGVETPLFRAPFGGFNSKGKLDPRIPKIAHSLGMDLCGWNIDTVDYTKNSPKEIQKIVIKELKMLPTDESPTILAHVLKHSNILEALDGIIDGSEELGYEFCMLPKEPTTPGELKSLPC